jgi:hypothetical protein
MKKKLIIFLKLLIFLILLLGWGLPGFGERVVSLPDLLKPEAVTLDHQQMYVVEITTIYIYRLKDFKLMKKFGKRGEGPGEFLVDLESGRPLFLDVQTDEIMVSSLGKVSFFSKTGVFNREMKVKTAEYVQPLGKGFVAQSLQPGKEKVMRAIFWYDEMFQPAKEIIKVPHHFQMGKGLEVFRESQDFLTMDNQLFVTWDPDFKITIFDSQGNKMNSIVHPYQRVKVTELHRQQVIHYLKTHPFFKEYFELLKPIRFPGYFPAIREMRIADGKLYIVTYKEKNEQTECFVFDLKGKLLSRQYVKLEKKNPLEFSPFAFKNGALYQLVEKDEEWYLHIHNRFP